jgi:hypothetical protein
MLLLPLLLLLLVCLLPSNTKYELQLYSMHMIFVRTLLNVKYVMASTVRASSKYTVLLQQC